MRVMRALTHAMRRVACPSTDRNISGEPRAQRHPGALKRERRKGETQTISRRRKKKKNHGRGVEVLRLRSGRRFLSESFPAEHETAFFSGGALHCEGGWQFKGERKRKKGAVRGTEENQGKKKEEEAEICLARSRCLVR